MPNHSAPANSDETRFGIFLVVVGLCIAALIGALMKILVEDLHAVQITFVRFLGFALLLLPLVVKLKGPQALYPARPKIQFLRGISLAAATVTFVLGAAQIHYADAIAILYAYPFLLTIMAALFLGEKVTTTGWIGVIGGFAGVLLVIRPSFSSINTGTLYVFASALIVSIQMTFNRQLGKSVDPLITSLWGALVASVLLVMVAWKYWLPLNVEQLAILSFIAVIGMISQLCIVYGFSKAEASKIAPFTYIEIIAAVLYGMLFFGTLPGLLSWLGMILIASSGILVAKTLKSPVAPRRNPKI
ncbi:MAG: DMT family transporter [Gammaproteobacteria bacterium]|nr:DMT family transporter [Gammaproteobacteria bacterium]